MPSDRGSMIAVSLKLSSTELIRQTYRNSLFGATRIHSQYWVLAELIGETDA